MQQLAEFEGYAGRFKITEAELRCRYFERQEFGILVAEVEGRLAGILVYYFQPFTYDLCPWMVVKELFVDRDYRRLNIGRELMQSAAAICLQQGGSKMRWDVLCDNRPAQAFYRALGGRFEQQWQGFCLDGERLHRLANDSGSLP